VYYENTNTGRVQVTAPAAFGGVDEVPEDEDDSFIDTTGAKKNWNKLKTSLKGANAFKKGNKGKIRRLSKVMKGRRASEIQMKAEVRAASSNETSNKSKRKSFIKVTNDEIGEDDYFQDIETGETVWEMPEDGDLVVSGDVTIL